MTHKRSALVPCTLVVLFTVATVGTALDAPPEYGPPKVDRCEVMGRWKVAVHDNTRLYQP